MTLDMKRINSLLKTFIIHTLVMSWILIGASCSESGTNRDQRSQQLELQSGLLAHWPMNEGSGTIAQDTTGSGHSGQLANGATWHKEGGITFDGVDDYVDVGAMDVPGTALTITARFFANDLANCSSRDCRILSKATGVQSADHYMMLSTITSNGQTRLRFRLKTDGATKTLIASSDSVSENTWVHVAAVYDGATMRLYQDGVDVGSTSKTGPVTTNSAVHTWIGGNPSGATHRPWDGHIRDVRIYSKALSNTEIQALVSPGNRPPVANAGPDQQIKLAQGQSSTTVTLQAGASFDAEGPIVAYRWSGTPDPADETSPQVTLGVGTHQFVLEVEDRDGATDQDTTTVVVLPADDPANIPPVANAGDDQQIQLAGGQNSIAVRLDGSGSTDQDGRVVAYRWTGTPDPADISTPEITLAAGQYVFELEVEDDSQATAVDSVVVTVLSPPTGSNQPPVARASADPTTGHTPLIVHFDGSASSDPEGANLTYQWDFGDGETSDRANPTHVFFPGEHSVTLTVTDSAGASHISNAIIVDVHDEGTDDHDLPHQDSPGKQHEHLAAFSLVERSEATHVALYDGSWDDPSVWYGGNIPNDNSRVWIPEDITVTIAHQDTARLATVRVDGKLSFDPMKNTQLNVDTLVVDGHGTLEMGSEAAPVQSNRTAKLVIIDRGHIDLNWDPEMLSRGMISHGTMIAHGAAKTAFLPLAVEPMKGATELVLSEAPVNWKVGDELVLTGVSPFENQDELLTILGVNGNRIAVRALAFDHNVPESDLQVYVANLSRNVMIESENKTDVLRRGHVMFMHSQKVNIQYCKTVETGRTDKTFAINEIELDSAGQLVPGTGNIRGRYALHFHRTGVSENKIPAVAKGVVVFGSPGWGMVNHSSFLHASDNVSYNVLGAGFVGEVGNEVGYYRHNIAIRSQGSGQHETDKRQFVSGSEHLGRNDDFGHGGHGFWFQGPLIEVEDNIAAGHRHFGFVFWNRGLIEFDLDSAEDISRVGSTSGSTPKIPVASVIDIQPELTVGVEYVRSEDVMIRRFRNNTTFASGAGLEISRHMRGLSSRYHSLGWKSIIENFTAWNVGHYRNKFGHGPISDTSDGGLFNPQSGDNGISVRYSTRIVLKNPRLLGINEPKSTGINHNHFADTCAIVSPVIKRFDQVIRNEGVFVDVSSF